jgi:hypothetical protein
VAGDQRESVRTGNEWSSLFANTQRMPAETRSTGCGRAVSFRTAQFTTARLIRGKGGYETFRGVPAVAGPGSPLWGRGTSNGPDRNGIPHPTTLDRTMVRPPRCWVVKKIRHCRRRPAFGHRWPGRHLRLTRRSSCPCGIDAFTDVPFPDAAAGLLGLDSAHRPQMAV